MVEGGMRSKKLDLEDTDAGEGEPRVGTQIRIV
jgi:hypothetical protein